MLTGYKTLIGAITLGLSTAIGNLETAGVLPAGTLDSLTAIGQGLGFFFVAWGIGDKLDRKLRG